MQTRWQENVPRNRLAYMSFKIIALCWHQRQEMLQNRSIFICDVFKAQVAFYLIFLDGKCWGLVGVTDNSYFARFLSKLMWWHMWWQSNLLLPKTKTLPFSFKASPHIIMDTLNYSPVTYRNELTANRVSDTASEDNMNDDFINMLLSFMDHNPVSDNFTDHPPTNTLHSTLTTKSSGKIALLKSWFWISPETKSVTFQTEWFVCLEYDNKYGRKYIHRAPLRQKYIQSLYFTIQRWFCAILKKATLNVEGVFVLKQFLLIGFIVQQF